MLISRSLMLAALCLYIAGCGGGDAESTTADETELGAVDELGPAEPIAQSLTETGDVPEPASDDTETTVNTANFVLSPENMKIEFIGTHVGDDPNPRTCEFTDFRGGVQINTNGGTVHMVIVEIQTSEITTFNPDLTNHLKNEEFLDVREHPTILFETTSVDDGDGRTILNGELTLMGVTNSVSFPADVSITGSQLSLTATLTINRTDYGMDQLLDRVLDEVEINVTVTDAS